MKSEVQMSSTNDTLAGNRKAMDRFLERLAQTGNVMLSARAAGVPRRTVYRWRDKWSTFADEWGEALDEAVDTLEGVAWKRAAKQSDRLLIFLLKAHRPDFYKERRALEHSGKDGETLVVEFKGNIKPDAL